MAEVSMHRCSLGLRFYTGVLKVLGTLCVVVGILVLVMTTPDESATLLVAALSLLSGLLLIAGARWVRRSYGY